MSIIGVSVHITGIVQGVGFRPFVYNLAEKLSLSGWVRNTSAGVDILLQGPPAAVKDFLSTLKQNPPPLSKIENIATHSSQPQEIYNFRIIHSEPVPDAFQPISPDVCICNDCLRELFTPTDRRYRYPFINCTNCGPRFTIIQDIPYDRSSTTMADFPMCPACRSDYEDPRNRRFHAQPIACSDCGPHVWLESGIDGTIVRNDAAINSARKLLYEGKILAIKGLGGFHLACDATNPSAVIELRNRKLRIDKPFALMLPDLHTVEKHCLVDEISRQLLSSPQRPIVILPRRPGSKIVPEVSPNQNTIGIMLPYTPLHYLLFAKDSTSNDHLIFDDLCLVMTSGNFNEEPIATDNDEARQRLSTLADAFLFHDRPIYIRCDDSVVRILNSGHLYSIRRSRSYAPSPIHLSHTSPPLLATGSELKNTFCLARGNHAFLSHHIGDMENFETLQSYMDGVTHLESLFRIQPELLACDLHPDYLATHYAVDRSQREGIALKFIQHHHAHIAACMVENGLKGDEPVIGVALDGTGYGEDGAIWGGEFLVSDYDGYQRAFHLKYYPLPGGDVSIRKPARIALAYLWQSGIPWDKNLPCVDAIDPEERSVLISQLEHLINTPMTSSMGRLFDAAASIIGIKHQVNYEAQAAIELEDIVDPFEKKSYPFILETSDNYRPGLIDPKPMIAALCSDVLSNTPTPTLAARFHNTIAEMIGQTVHSVRLQTGINLVVLSGGVWQNMTLLNKSLDLLKNDHFIVYTHSQVPTNDGGISLGQAAIASYQSVSGIKENLCV